MKRAVITGATGSVGNGLIYELIDNGYEVLVLTRKDSPRNIYIPEDERVRVVYCALDELGSLKDIDKAGGSYDIFFHLGWGGTVGNGRNDFNMQLKNIGYTMDAVDLAARLGCNTFVGIGSQAECGRVNEKISPDTVCHPDNAYGAAKHYARHMSQLYAKQYDMKHIWVRLLTVYGPFDGNGFVAPTIRKLKAGEIPGFTKAEQIWDFLYYKDSGTALRLLGENGVDGKVYVIGWGEERSLASYIKEMNNAIAPDKEFRIGEIPYAENQVMYLCADNTEVKSDVGWKPRTDFAAGVRQTLQTMEELNMI